MQDREQSDRRLRKIVALAETYRAARGPDLSQQDIVDVAKELDIPEREVRHAIAHVDASSAGRGLTITSTADELWLTSAALGWRWPIVARVAASAGVVLFVAGLGVRVLAQSLLMAAAAIPMAAVGAWYTYRCIALAAERVFLALGARCSLRVNSLPLLSRSVEFDLSEFDVAQPELADDEEGGLKIAPIHWLPLFVKGRVINICAGHSKRELTSGQELVAQWLNTQRARTVQTGQNTSPA